MLAASVVFGVAHSYQGGAGMFLSGAAGIVYGTHFAWRRPSLWLSVIAHGVYDTIAFVALFTGAAQV